MKFALNDLGSRFRPAFGIVFDYISAKRARLIRAVETAVFQGQSSQRNGLRIRRGWNTRDE